MYAAYNLCTRLPTLPCALMGILTPRWARVCLIIVISTRWLASFSERTTETAIMRWYNAFLHSAICDHYADACAGDPPVRGLKSRFRIHLVGNCDGNDWILADALDGMLSKRNGLVRHSQFATTNRRPLYRFLRFRWALFSVNGFVSAKCR